MSLPNAGPLGAIRVLDFGKYVAGPYCATLLADLGADVIRIERPGGNDDRTMGPIAADGTGSTYLAISRNKRNLTLDHTSREGRAVFERLVASADVVVANLPARRLSALSLDYDSLRAIRADIIVTTVDTFGPEGPYSDAVGFDGIAQAMSGSVYMSGTPGNPVKSTTPWVDYLTGTQAAVGTLGALRARDLTGSGQHVYVSLLDSALVANASLLIEQSANKSNWPPIGNRSHLSALADIYQTKDGFILLQLAGDGMFHRWVDVIGDPEWHVDPRFANDDLRIENREPLAQRNAEWCAARPTADVIKVLRASGIPCGPVYSPQDVLEDEHVVATNALPDAIYPDIPVGTRAPRSAINLSSAPERYAPPVGLGENTDEILSELAFEAAAIAHLRAHGVC